MKHLYLYIFLLTLELFTTPSQGLPIGCHRKCQKFRTKQTITNTWKPDKPEDPRSIAVVNRACPTLLPHDTQKIVKCIQTEDDPEKWFVKVYQIPDIRPQRYILFSMKDDKDELESESSPKISIDVNKDFKRCSLRRINDRLILLCTPHKTHPRVSRKSGPSIFYTKFLQINEPKKPKNSFLSDIIKGKCPPYSDKK